MRTVILFLTLTLASFTLFGSPVESWYLHIGAGYSHFQSDHENQIEDGIDLHDLKRFKMNLDLGFYMPYSQNTLIGGVIFSEVDNLDTRNPHTEEWDESLRTYLFAASVLHFFQEMNSGFFVRGDLGFNYSMLDHSRDEAVVLKKMGTGPGARVAAGYAIDFAPEYSLMLSLGYTVRGYGDDQLRSFNVNASFLF